MDLNSPGMRVKPRRSSGRVSKRRSSISRPSPLVANSISSEQDRPSPSSLPRNVSKSEKSAFAPAKSAKKASPAIGESLEIESSFDFVEETSDKVAIKLSTSAEKSVSEAGGVEQEAASGQRAWLGRAHASRDSTVPTRKSVSRHFAESPGQGTRTRSLRERKSSENQKTEDNPKTGESVRRSSPRKQPAKAELQEGTGIKYSRENVNNFLSSESQWPSKAKACDSFTSGSHARVRCFRTLEFYWIRRDSARQRRRHASFTAKALHETWKISRNGRAETPARSGRLQQES